jgi:hypothetical protein
MKFMTAGACIDEPEHGDRRVIVGNVHRFDPDDARANEDGYVAERGKLVQEFSPRTNADGWFVEGGGYWQTLCPLVDFEALYGR